MRRLFLLAPVLALASAAFSQTFDDQGREILTVTPAMLVADTPADTECLTYDLASLEFRWQPCAPTVAKYITAADHAGLSADIFPSGANQVPVSSGVGAASWTTVPDAALANSYSGVGSCAAAAAVVATVDNAAPTCDANVMFDDEANTVSQSLTLSDGVGDSPSLLLTPQTGATWDIFAATNSLFVAPSAGTGSATLFLVQSGANIASLDVEGTLNASNYPSGGADDRVIVADSSTASTWRALPTGIVAQALAYTSSSNSFSQAAINNLASSTSANLSTVLSDEAGTGKVLFANSLLVVTGSDFTTTNTANQTITGLSWSGASGTNYWFDCNLAVTGTATGGPLISVTSSGSSTTISYAITGHTTSATTETYTGGSASGTQSASCTSSCLTSDIPFRVTGMIRPSASVTLAIAAANSTSGQTTTVKIGSSCLVLTP